MSKYVVGVDVGTTGSKAMVLDLQGNIYGKGYREYALNYPNPDWVEVGANFLLGVTFEAVKEAVNDASEQQDCGCHRNFPYTSYPVLDNCK